MFCKECGKEFVSDQSNFCLECGVQRGRGNNYCPFCGEMKKTPNQDVCLKCGGNVKSKGPLAGGVSDKTKLIVLLLWFFVGGLGIHHFYAGNNKRGTTYLIIFAIAFVLSFVTCGVSYIVTGILMIIDLVQLLTDKMVDGDGNVITEWN